MIIILRAVLYDVVLSVGSLYCLIANAQSGPPYGNGTSVFVPFDNAPLPPDTQPHIRFGFQYIDSKGKPYNGPVFSSTMDTGSIGIVVGSNYFNAPGHSDPSYIGAATEYLVSSGVIYHGDWYSATVNVYIHDARTNKDTVAVQSTVPVLAVNNVTCQPNAPRCNPKTPPVAAQVIYFGVGFSSGPYAPQGTPDKNAFLNVTNVPGQSSLPSPGYMLSTQGVQIGLTSSNTQGFALIKLEPLLAPPLSQWQAAPASTSVLTDWQHAAATITVNGVSASGIIQFDTGVNTGILTPPLGVTVQTGMGPNSMLTECNPPPSPAACAVTGTSVQASFTSLSNPVAFLKYTVGPNNGAQTGNPISPFALTVNYNRQPYLNTSVAFLQTFEYFYDAANGFIGLKANTTTPSQYATTAPSGLALGSVFQCFFNSAGSIFGPSWSSLSGQPTGYSWPYTYRYNPFNKTYVAISSALASTPGTTPLITNDVYILGPNLQPTYQAGSLSGWLAAMGCQ
jgi:hypothetical protein